MKLFAVCDPGLEPFLAQEMTELRLLPEGSVPGTGRYKEGGIAFEGNLSDLCRANLWLRTASRVLVRLGEFRAVRFVELRRKTHHLPWEDFLAQGQPVTLRVTSHASKLYVKNMIAKQIRLGIADRLGGAPPPAGTAEHAGHLVVVRFNQNTSTISVDSSGEHLHRRGYRLATAKAPLRETLAAAMVLASHWDISSPLLDPFCGSGTIPIEAGLLALGIPPGRSRRFQFQEWPTYDHSAWETILHAADSHRTITTPPIIGSDRDNGAIKSARENAERAGVAEYIEFTRRSISDVVPLPGPGWIVTNPPYGVRTRVNKDLRNLYDRFGDLLHFRFSGWHVAMLGTDDRLLTRTRLIFEQGISLNSGGIRVKLARGVVGS